MSLIGCLRFAFLIPLFGSSHDVTTSPSFSEGKNADLARSLLALE
jgi:hypothetical protein